MLLRGSPADLSLSSPQTPKLLAPSQLLQRRCGVAASYRGARSLPHIRHFQIVLIPRVAAPADRRAEQEPRRQRANAEPDSQTKHDPRQDIAGSLHLRSICHGARPGRSTEAADGAEQPRPQALKSRRMALRRSPPTCRAAEVPALFASRDQPPSPVWLGGNSQVPWLNWVT